MKLTDLKAKWLHPSLFVFLCPHCQKDWLAVNDGYVSEGEQFALYEKEFGEDWNLLVVPCGAKPVWTFQGRDFASMTVRPSIDASKSGPGHWHGFITAGVVR